MSGNELPSYSASSSSAQPAVSSTAAAAAITSHTYSLENKGKPWLSLNIKNSRSQSAKTLPIFYAGDEVKGSVDVNLDKAESAKSVVIRLVAGTTTVGQEEFRFHDESQSLWTGAKLNGSLSWPFALRIPEKVQAEHEEKGPKSEWPAPPTFTERASPAYIDWKVIVIVKRGTFKVDLKLSTSIVHAIRTMASPPSELRRQAYEEDHGLVDPDGDPSGWKALEPITIKGTLFDDKEVSFTYQFHIAAPLSYAIGTPIPLLCTLSCADAQALDLLSASPAIGLHLTRTLAIGSTAAGNRSTQQKHTLFKEHSAKAIWWPSTNRKPEGGKRFLQGEIQVRRGIKPGFIFPRLSLYYDITLLPPKATGLTLPSGTDPTAPLLSEQVEICAVNPPGFTPRSAAPPGYVVEEEQGNYATSMGMLENGNQRFLGHHHTLG